MLQSILLKIGIFLRVHTSWALAAVFALAAVAGALLAGAILFSPSPESEEDRLPAVEVASIASLSGRGTDLSFVGVVRSRSEATVLAEATGRILYVRGELGNTVSAGTVIAEIENGRERAALAQAQAALQSAQANLLQAKGSAGRTLEAAQADALVTYRGAFTAVDDAVNNKTEPFYREDQGIRPQLIVSTVRKNELEQARVKAYTLLTAWERSLSTVENTTALLEDIARAQADTRAIEQFLNELATVANDRERTDDFGITDADRAGLLAGRTAVSNSLIALNTAYNTLSRALPSQAMGASGEQEASLAAAEAAVAQAQANVQAAQANLSKALIRAPISGTINSINLEVGNFVGVQTPVLTIANNNALEVETFITASDKEFLQIGDIVLVDNTYEAVVTNIAPGLDPTTNKIKVEIGLVEGSDSLVHGDTVRVSLTASENAPVERASESARLVIPITALKVETDRIVVFTISREHILVAHPIVEGPLLGRNIIIEEGVTADMEIVLDARGLNEGDRVTILSS